MARGKWIVIFTILLPACAVAQRRIILGVELALPYNSLTSVASGGIGLTTKYDRFVSKHLAITFSVDFVSFGKVYSLNPGSAHVEASTKLQTLSEQLGGKYYFRKKNEPKGLYLSLEGGIQTSWLKYYDAGKQYGSVDQTDFCYRYGFGISGKRLDVGLLWQKFEQRNYEIAWSYGMAVQNNPLRYFCLRIAYILPD